MPALIIVLALIGYGRMLGDGFVCDDWCLLNRASLAEDFAQCAGLDEAEKAVHLRPLNDLSWWVNFVIGGTNPFVYRLWNLAFHAANAWLVSRLVLASSASRFASGVAAVVFLSLSVHSEAVSWLSGRVDVVSATGCLAALLGWTRFLSSSGTWMHLAAACAWFAFALGCKEMGMAVPPLALVLMFALPRQPARKRVAGWIALLFVLLVYAVLRYAYFGGVGGPKDAVGDPLVAGFSLERTLAFLRSGAEAVFFPRLAGAEWAGWISLTSLCVAAAWSAFAGGFRHSARWVAVFLGMALAALAPLITWAVVPADGSEGGRYYYLSSAFTSAAIGALFLFVDRTPRQRSRALACILVAALVAANMVQLLELNTHWHTAARITRTMIDGVRLRYQDLVESPPLFVCDLPDKHGHAIVFRNGFVEAIALFVSREIRVKRYPRVRWNMVRSSAAADPESAAVFLRWDATANAWREE